MAWHAASHAVWTKPDLITSLAFPFCAASNNAAGAPASISELSVRSTLAGRPAQRPTMELWHLLQDLLQMCCICSLSYENRDD